MWESKVPLDYHVSVDVRSLVGNIIALGSNNGFGLQLSIEDEFFLK